MTDIKNENTESYFLLLKNLEMAEKLKLISKLSDSILNDQDEKEKIFFNLCGKLKLDISADNFINDIYNDRYFNQNRDINL